MHAKRMQDPAQLVQLVKECHDLHFQLFHYAAAIGDCEFFSTMMAFLPTETLVKELQLQNHNGMSSTDCAKIIHPVLASKIEAFLLARGSGLQGSVLQHNLKPLSPGHFVRLPNSPLRQEWYDLEMATCSLDTFLARCGWKFASSPRSVYRQIQLGNFSSASSAEFLLHEKKTNKLFYGRDCYRFLTTTQAPCDEYEIFNQCSASDGSYPVLPATTAVYVEWFGNPSLQRLQWDSTDQLELFEPPPSPVTLSAFLAPRVKLFDGGQVFIEATRTFVLESEGDLDLLLIKVGDQQSHVTGYRAKLIAGSSNSEKLRGFGFRSFIEATSSTEIVSPRAAVLVKTPDNLGMDPNLQRVEANPNRFVACSKTASTVGATLRLNEIYYAATRAVYVKLVEFNNLDSFGGKLLAFPGSNNAPAFLWSGSKIAKLAGEESFRAAFDIFAPCQDAWQQLAPGMTVLLDIENLSPTPSAEENVIILRYYPQPGEINTTTPTPHDVCISASGVRVADKGYQDDVFFKGFRRGWVENDVYWRVVGNSPNCFISGGTVDNKCKFNIYKDHDRGYDNTRIMVKLPHEGIVYCRGVGGDFKNPEMACVLFNRDGRVRDRYGYLGKLGHWKDIFQ